MIESLPCGCCKTTPLKSNFLRIRNELFKGNVVFFDNPFCECCGIDDKEKFYLGQMIYLNELVMVQKYFPLQGITEQVAWNLVEFKNEMKQMIIDEFEFSYINADVSFKDNEIVVKYLN